MDIRGAVVLIAGGGSGLGEACARRFAAAGARVIILDLNSATGKALAESLGASASFIKADVGLESDVHQAMNEVSRAFGALHVAINVAGIGSPEPILAKEGLQPFAHFERVMRVNLYGTYHIMRMAAALMARNKPNGEGERGVIINTASIAAYDGDVGQAAYAASKAAVGALTLPAAREFAPLGIRVMSIAPGLFETPLLEALPAAERDELGRHAPFPSRLGRPEEYAHLAQAIVENPMLNGEVIRLDGAARLGTLRG
jgi:NAD(P)-dependent dehydrogenase (short-subunit alcohol dehydrogenase family)